MTLWRSSHTFLALIAHLLQIDYRGFQSRDACQQLAGMGVSRSNSGLLKELLQLPGTIEIAQRPPGALDHVGRTIVLDKVVDDACRHGRGDMTIVRTVGINKIVCLRVRSSGNRTRAGP